MVTNEIITAVDISSMKSSVDSKLESNIKQWIKSQLSSRVRTYLKEKRVDNPEYKLSQQEKDEFKTEILQSKDLQQFTENQRALLISKADNFLELRRSFGDLNDLNPFSAELELADIYTYKQLRTPQELIKHIAKISYMSIGGNTIKNELITAWLSRSKNVRESMDVFALLMKIRDMYGIKKTMDDMVLFDRYEFNTNIDYSTTIGEYYTLLIGSNGNVINDWYQNLRNPIEKLNKRVIVDNRLLSVLCTNYSQLGQTGLEHNLISNNAVTTYKSTYVTTNNNEYTFVTRTLGELLFEITNPELSDIDKTARQQIYTTYDGTRPLGDEYYKWNGLQVFDIDLKPWLESKDDGEKMVEMLKRHIYNELSKFHWFLWVAKSASGKGIHIYTKVAPMHHIFTDIRSNENLCKYWYQINYVTKHVIVNNALTTFKRFTPNDINEFGECKYLDTVVSRITAGIRLTYDSNILVNQSFLDLPVAYWCSNNDNADAVNELLVQKLFESPSKFVKKYLTYIDDLVASHNGDNIAVKEKIVPKNVKFETFDDYNSLEVIPRSKLNYTVRYNVCNTLASIFGKDGLEIAHTILQSKECGNEKEINGFYSCALSNKKEPSKYGLELLSKTGVVKNIMVPESYTNNGDNQPNGNNQSSESSDVKYVPLKQYTDNLFKNGIRSAIESIATYDSMDLNSSMVIKLNDNQYLGDVADRLLDGGFTNSKINILISPAGSGKTNLLLEMARQGKRILLVEPYISVIKNKVESDIELMKIFDTFYGDKQLNDIESGINAITTFDKFSRCNYEKVSKLFDYICIDESHLLFTSSYRIEATSSAIRKLKDLFFISNNDPFSAKIILMTGTETGDTHFFGRISNVIRVEKKGLDKHMEFLICDDGLDAVTRLSYKAYQLLNAGYRLIIPTNKGEIYSHKLIGMVEYLLQRPLKYGYYKRSNVEQEICRMINEQNTIGDYEIVFCSNYLSVGVDIVDKYKFASIYYGPFSGYEIEQFNARIRKTSIYSLYCIQTETASGDTNDLLLEEPDMVLKLNEEDITNFIDDKQIAAAKQEFIAQYDPVLHKIVTPGFSYLNGAIRFNKEEYELVMFEQKYLEAMIHPVKVARELFRYQYKITVSPEYDGLEPHIQNELKKIGIESAREEKIRKHNLMVGTYLGLIDNNSYTSPEGLEFNNIIDFIGKHRDLIIEDREMSECISIDFNVFGTPVQVFVKSKEAFENMYGPAKYLITKYSPTRAKDIILGYTDENGILKQKNFKRAINLLKLIDKSDSNDLSEPIFKTIERVYTWLDEFNINKNHRISYNTYQAELDAWTNSYIDMLGIKVNSTYGFQKIRDNIQELLNDLATKNTNKSGIRFEYNKLPDTDGILTRYKQTVDSLIENTFKVSMNINGLQSVNPKSKHVVLVRQDF